MISSYEQCPLCGKFHHISDVRSFDPSEMGCMTMEVIGEGAVSPNSSPEWPMYDDGETWRNGELDFECLDRE